MYWLAPTARARELSALNTSAVIASRNQSVIGSPALLRPNSSTQVLSPGGDRSTSHTAPASATRRTIPVDAEAIKPPSFAQHAYAQLSRTSNSEVVSPAMNQIRPPPARVLSTSRVAFRAPMSQPAATLLGRDTSLSTNFSNNATVHMGSPNVSAVATPRKTQVQTRSPQKTPRQESLSLGRLYATDNRLEKLVDRLNLSAP
jgi:hypothetical protein